MAEITLYQDELIQIMRQENQDYFLIVNKNEFAINPSQFTELIKTPLSKIEAILDSINPQIRCRLKEKSLDECTLAYAFLKAYYRGKCMDENNYAKEMSKTDLG